jgi:D-alanine-D-alanine ligase
MRIDRDGKIYILEVNPNPDISPSSGMARAIRIQGMTYSEFIGKVIEKAFQRRM